MKNSKFRTQNSKLIIIFLIVLCAAGFGYGKYNLDKTDIVISVAASNTLTALRINADHRCTGTDDQTVINTAIDSLDGYGGTVYLLAGDYYISDEIEIEVSNLRLTADGGAKIIDVQAESTLAVEVTPGAVAPITVVDASEFRAGQIIRLIDTGETFYDTFRITSILGNVLTLEGAYFGEYSNFENTFAVGSHVIQFNDMIRVHGQSGSRLTGITVEGLYLDGDVDGKTIKEVTGGDEGTQNDYYENGLRIYYCDDIVVRDCWFEDIVYNSILCHGGGVGVNYRFINNNIETQSDYSQSRGIAVENATTSVLIQGNYITSSRVTVESNCNGIYVIGAIADATVVIVDNFIKGFVDALYLSGIRAF